MYPAVTATVLMPSSWHAFATSTAYSRNMTGSLYVKATLRHCSALAARADVTFIPIRKGGTYDNCDPVIVYEYLLCGKPVVATPYPSAVELPTFVSTAETPAAFERAIESALARGKDASAVRERVEFAFANAWEARAAEALRIISSHRAGGGAAAAPTGEGAPRASEDGTTSSSGERDRCQ